GENSRDSMARDRFHGLAAREFFQDRDRAADQHRRDQVVDRVDAAGERSGGEKDIARADAPGRGAEPGAPEQNFDAAKQQRWLAGAARGERAQDRLAAQEPRAREARPLLAQLPRQGKSGRGAPGDLAADLQAAAAQLGKKGLVAGS